MRYFIIVLLIIFNYVFAINMSSFIRTSTYTGEVVVHISSSSLKILSGIQYYPPSSTLLDVLRSVIKDTSEFIFPREIYVTYLRSQYTDSLSSSDILTDTIDPVRILVDNNANIKVVPGMCITIPEQIKYIFVKGELIGNIVTLNGKFPILENETIESILRYITLTPDADTTSVFLIRNGEFRIVDKSDFPNMILLHGDCIVFQKKKDHPMYFVYVKGEVEKPGIYPIKHSETKLWDVLEKAKLLSTADRFKILIYRNTSFVNVNQIQSPRPEVLSSIKNIDFSSIPIKGDSATVLLSEDIIEVPKCNNYVYIQGFVRNPSVVPYNQNYKVIDYIKAAGGFSKSADRFNVRLITPYGKLISFNDIDKVNPGDIILVPESTESKWTKTWLPIINAASSMLSVAVALISISIKFK